MDSTKFDRKCKSVCTTYSINFEILYTFSHHIEKNNFLVKFKLQFEIKDATYRIEPNIS